MSETDIQAGVLEILDEHDSIGYSYVSTEVGCTCGWRQLSNADEATEAYRRHLAGVIAQWVVENKGVQDGKTKGNQA